MTQRRFDESDEEWRARLQRCSVRDEVRKLRDDVNGAYAALRREQLRARLTYCALTVAASFVIMIVGVVVLERWFDGFAPLLGLAIPSLVISLLGGLCNLDFIEKYHKSRFDFIDAHLAHAERYAEYIDAGGGTDSSDAYLSVRPEVAAAIRRQ